MTADAALLEVGRAGAAGYVDQEEIAALPISGRDFVQFALLQPTVKVEPRRGGISLSGQRGTDSGLTIDGADAKSAFFGYGRGGEATENGGLVVAQESVQEFQVVTSGYSAEAGRSGGGYINVVTKTGTNDFAGSTFLFYRGNEMVARLPRSPLDAARGIAASDERYEVDEFERYNWGASLGGPIVRDRTHFFFSYDQSARSQPFLRDIRGRGQYDAVFAAYPDLLAGFTPNDDGIAAADPSLGRTASGQFVREVDNLILFGKLSHRLNDDHTLTLRYNLTDFARESDFVAEESRKLERTHAVVGSLVSLIGTNGVNELRVQYAYDDLDRLANLSDRSLQANFRIFEPSFGDFGKPWWLPIHVDEQKWEIQERYSFLVGNHEIRAGASLSHDILSEYFAGNADGRYDFDTVADFASGDAARARIFFGNVENPNFDVSQQTVGLYLQDSWSPNHRLTLNYGLRWDATLNPGGIEHVLPEGASIPDDLDNLAPRAGFSWSLDGRSLLRGGAGVFHARTPTLLFFAPYSDTGIFPRFGNAIVAPGDIGYVPLGGPIDNANPPAGLTPSLSHVHPHHEDPRTVRFNLGYEREIGRDLAASLDVVYARGDQLGSSVDANVPAPTRDAWGRPVYSGERLNPAWGTILVRNSLSRSDYAAVTATVRRRFREGIRFQAHYTWSRDRSNDDNERSATGPHAHGSVGSRLRLGPVEPGHPASLRGQRSVRAAVRHPPERDPHRAVRVTLDRPRPGGGLPRPPRLLDRAARPPDPRDHRRRGRGDQRRAERRLDEPGPPDHEGARPRPGPHRGALRGLQPPERRLVPRERGGPAGTPPLRRSDPEPGIRARRLARRKPAPGAARPAPRVLTGPRREPTRSSGAGRAGGRDLVLRFPR